MGLLDSGLSAIVTTALDKIFPDKNEAAKAKIRYFELEQAGEFKVIDADLALAKQQNDVNLEEAKNDNVFVSGWRPGLGWVMVLSLFANYIAVPLMAWGSPWLGVPPPPRLEVAELYPLLFGMLGLGGLRTTEKIKGVKK